MRNERSEHQSRSNGWRASVAERPARLALVFAVALAGCTSGGMDDVVSGPPADGDDGARSDPPASRDAGMAVRDAGPSDPPSDAAVADASTADGSDADAGTGDAATPSDAGACSCEDDATDEEPVDCGSLVTECFRGSEDACMEHASECSDRAGDGSGDGPGFPGFGDAGAEMESGEECRCPDGGDDGGAGDEGESCEDLRAACDSGDGDACMRVLSECTFGSGR